MMRVDLEQRLRFCRTLPSLPGVALKILELGRDPDASLADLTKVISPDPVLSAKLLKAANSPLYAQRRKTDNLRQAVSLLGLNTSLTLTLSFSLKTSLGDTKTSFDTALYWRRSVLTAIACRSLSEQCLIGSPEQLFLAGLLRDIGILALDNALPDDYVHYVAAAMGVDATGAQYLDAERLVAIEREHLATDHAGVGAWLLRQWNLPDYLPMAVAGGQDPEVVDMPLDMRPFVHCVALGGRLADVWLRANDKQISMQAAQLAEQWLDIDKQGYLSLLQTISAKIPEFSALFEIQLVDPVQIAGILSEAKEILILRNLQLIQEATEAKQVAEVLESRTRILEEQSRLDALTGLCNRGGLDEALKKEFQRASEEGWPLSLAFVDLDYFKQINDSYGHGVGDQVLVSVARLLADCIRKTDLVARYGGEEFVVLLPGTGYKGAKILAERLVEELRAQRHTTDTTRPIQVTASIGLATHMDDNQHFTMVGDLLNAADQALYAAKHAGRNQVVSYADLN